VRFYSLLDYAYIDNMYFRKATYCYAGVSFEECILESLDSGHIIVYEIQLQEKLFIDTAKGKGTTIKDIIGYNEIALVHKTLQ